MRVAVTIYCEGFQRECGSAITTGLAPYADIRTGVPEAFTRLREHASASGWDLRAVQVGAHEEVHAYCRDCTDRLQRHTDISGIAHTIRKARDTPDQWRPADDGTQWVAPPATAKDPGVILDGGT